ncbi:MAG: hypothetical protein SH847_07930 [Roseiflexaceae bacterium]|nr:hypothetical protein [Roseiflexaceae bacterium]
MQATTSDGTVAPARSTRKFILGALMLVILLVGALYVNNAYKALQPTSLPQSTVTISQSVLEQKYGLRVSLVAITAVGGMVDLRLKIIDAEKAKLLLADAKNFPALFSKNGVTLNTDPDTKSQKIEFVSNSNLFIMFPNSGNAITQGSPVTVLFGDTALEPINAK